MIDDYKTWVEQFKEEIYDKKSTDVDPHNDYYWGSLTYGWALGKGLSPADAKDLEIHIRSETPYG